MSFLLVANPTAGAEEPDLPAHAARELDDARVVVLGQSTHLAAEVEAAIEEGRIVVACGGDATIHAVAQHLAGSDGVLGILPGGTHNHFARDVGVDDPVRAIETLRTGAVRRVDVARADDRVFVNTLGIGLYPELVDARDRGERAVGRAVATLAAGARLWARFEAVRGTISADGDRRRLEASIAFVGVNRFSSEPGRFGERDRLDEGVLDVRVLPAPRGWLARARLGLDVALARVWPGRVARAIARSVEIVLDRPRPLALDGEPAGSTDRARVVVEAGALRLLVPNP